MPRPRRIPDSSGRQFLNPLAFYGAAVQRLEDAAYLYENGRTTGAVYLGGYAIECAIKSLILKATPVGKRLGIVESFRGSWAHDFDQLKALYYRIPNAVRFPKEISVCFSRVNGWGTELRYRHSLIHLRDTEIFLKDARSIVQWTKGRIE